VATPLAGWHPALYGALRTYTAVTAGKAGFSRTTPFGPPDTAARLAQPRISIGTGRSISLSAMRTLFVSRLSECWEGTPHRRVSDRRPGENAVRPCRRGHQQRWQPGHRGRIYLRASLRVFQRWKRTRVHRSQVSDQKGSAYGFALGDVNGDTFIDIALARSDAPNVLYLSGK
jgi:hypothetical protein